MPKVKKKFNPAVRNVPTFKKKRIKVGRHLPHANSTNTTIKAKKITLIEQIDLNESDNEEKSIKNENKGDGDASASKPSTVQKASGREHNLKKLDDVLSHLGHHNENLCRDAIQGVRNHFKYNSKQVLRNLHRVINGAGALLIRELHQTSTRNQLKCLVEQICDIPPEVFRSHFELFSAYVLTAVTDIRMGVRRLAFDVLALLFRRFPELCAQSELIYEKFLQLMIGQRRPTEDRLKLLDAIQQFLVTFSRPPNDSLWPEREIKFEFAKTTTASTPPSIQLLPSRRCFHFPVLYDVEEADSSSSSSAPSLQNISKLQECCAILCPFMAGFIHEEEGATVFGNQFNSSMTRIYSIISKLVDSAHAQIVANNNSSDVDGCVRASFSAAFAPLTKCPLIGGSKKLMRKLEEINAVSGKKR